MGPVLRGTSSSHSEDGSVEGAIHLRHLDVGVPGTPGARDAPHAVQPWHRHARHGSAVSLAVEVHRPAQPPHAPLSTRGLELGNAAPPLMDGYLYRQLPLAVGLLLHILRQPHPHRGPPRQQ
jgi:hypothetical protein